MLMASSGSVGCSLISNDGAGLLKEIAYGNRGSAVVATGVKENEREFSLFFRLRFEVARC